MSWDIGYDRVTLDGSERDLPEGLRRSSEKLLSDDNPDNKPLLVWRSHANNLYTNWLNYYVYQVTPYDLDGTPDFSLLEAEEGIQLIRDRMTLL